MPPSGCARNPSSEWLVNSSGLDLKFTLKAIDGVGTTDSDLFSPAMCHQIQIP